jgi:replication factor C small subunit
MMEGPLWTETHAPTLEELPQQGVRENFERAVTEPMNLVVHGPKGSGKTAGIRALTEEIHEQPGADRIEINVSDFFDSTKKEISQDPRFSQFIDSKRRRNSSKADLINHVLKESAGYSPVTGEYKTVVLDNAESMREDFQQALRRVMEQYYETTQFVIATRQPTSLIAPIRSRCFPIPVRAPTQQESIEVLEGILEQEGVSYDDEGLEYIAGAANGDLREAILSAQTTVEQEGELTMTAAYETLSSVDTDERVQEMLTDAETGAFTDARSTLDELLIDKGYSGDEVLASILDVARSRYTGSELAELHSIAGEIDLDLAQGTSDRIQLSQLLAELDAGLGESSG